jgi:hypothetical protein
MVARSLTHLRSPVAGVALAALLPMLAAAPAHAASLGLDQRCYVAGETAAVSGSGFSPRVPITITRGADTITGAVSDSSGSVRKTFLVPDITSGLAETQVEVSASDGVTSSHAYLNIATVGAAFTPTAGDPQTLRVSHSVSGFGLAEVKPSIYLHYVSPTAQKTPKSTTKTPATTTSAATSGGTNGFRLQTTSPTTPQATPADPPGVKSIRLGQLRGPCGVLRTSPRKLFPFKAEKGQWLLQYDTRPHYTKGTTNSPFLWVSSKVTVKGS